MRIHQAWALLGLLASAANAGAQPVVVEYLTPAPNAVGWLNSPVRVEYACARVASCPPPEVISTEGAGQEVAATARDTDGAEAKVAGVVNIDYTAPAVTIESPPQGHITDSPMVMVVAYASDALSGVAAASCNGVVAKIDATGRIQCIVLLIAGMNDIVVEVSDHANNSGSTGLRVLLRGAPSQLRVVPEEAGMLVGSTRTLQVLDDFGLDVPNVVWQVDNSLLLDVSTDGRHVLTARAPGPVVVTANYGGLTASSLVTIYAGDRLPPNSIRWKVDSLKVMQTPETTPLVYSERSLISTHQPLGGNIASVESINQVTGRLNWRMRPPVGPGDKVVTVREQAIGGAVMVIDRPYDHSFALVRGGGIATGAPWRYRSAGTIAADVVMHSDGGVSFIETLPDGFSRYVGITGDRGVVLHRIPLPTGVQVAMNVGCVAGANAAREVPGQVGPITAAPDAGALMFPVVVSDDREDFERCGSVSGRLQRILYVARIGADVKKVETVRVYDVPAGSIPPSVTMFAVSPDGHGGLLAPWTAISGDGTRESFVVRLSESGQQEYPLPTAGKIWLVGTNNDALMTDGTRLVVFNMLTGVVRWNHFYPTGVRVISVKDGTLLMQTKDKTGAYDSDGRPIPGKP